MNLFIMLLYIVLSLVLFTACLSSKIDAENPLFQKDVFLTSEVRKKLDLRIKRQVFQESIWKQPVSDEVQKFKGLAPVDFLSSVPNVLDVCIYDAIVVGEGRQLFVAAIVVREFKSKELKISKLRSEDFKWELIATVPTDAVRISNILISAGVLLILKEEVDETNQKITVMLVDDNVRFKKVQEIEQNFIGDFSVTHHENDIYLILPYGKGLDQIVEKCAVYKWKGVHFDLVDDIPANDAIVAGGVVQSKFLVGVAKRTASYDGAYSDTKLYKYDVEHQKFALVQKIPSFKPNQLDFFQISDGRRKEYFLLIDNGIENSHNVLIHKYVDDVFVPFQSIQMPASSRCLPIEAGKLKLLIFCNFEDTIEIHQYNGWTFEVVDVESNKKHINSKQYNLKAIEVLGSNMLASMGKEGEDTLEIYKLIFSKDDMIGKYREKLRNWCDKLHKEAKSLDLLSVARELGENLEDSKMNYVNFESSSIGEISAKKVIIDDEVIDSNSVQVLNNISEALKALAEITENVTKTLPSYLRKSTITTLPSLSANEIVIEGDLSNFESMKIDELNGQKFEELQSSLLLQKQESSNDFLIENLEANDVVFERLNDIPAKEFESIIRNYAKQNGVVVDGTVYANEGIIVKGLVDSVAFNKKNLLLKTEDQNLNTLFVSNMRAESLNTQQINDITQKEYLDAIQYYDVTSKESIVLDSLKVPVLVANGQLGSVKFDYMVNNTLKRSGNQILNTDVYVQDLKVNLFSSNSTLRDVYSTKDDVILKEDVRFKRLAMKSLSIGEILNDIPVIDGKLAVLRRNIKLPQRLIGYKNFENVKISGNITINEAAKSLLLSNTDKSLKDSLKSNGDLVLTGDVTINELATSSDIVSKNFSGSCFLESALKLTENVINIPVKIEGTATVKNIQTDSINRLSTKDIIFKKEPNTVLHLGKKVFNNVKVEGSCSGIKFINGQDMDEFANNVFRTNTDQEIDGNFDFNTITVDRVKARNAEIGGVPLTEALKYSGDHILKSKVQIDKDLTIEKSAQTIDLSVKGLIGDIKLETMIFDTVYKGIPINIKSKKVFDQPLIVDALTTTNKFLNVSARGLMSALNWNKKIEIPHSITITSPIRASHIIFKKKIDGIRAKDFGENWLLYEKNQTFTKPQTFSNVQALNDVIITKDSFNGLSLEYFNNILRTDNDTEIDFLNLDSLKTEKLIQINNKMGSINFEDMITTDSKEERIDNPVLFSYGMTVGGKITFDSLFGSRVSDMEAFYRSTSCDKNLFVKGKAVFNKEPEIGTVNNIDLKSLKNNIWFLNQDVVLDRPIEFNNLGCPAGIRVQGSVNGVSLEKLSKTYLSKTADQNITAAMQFDVLTAPAVVAATLDIETANITEIKDGFNSFIPGLDVMSQEPLNNLPFGKQADVDDAFKEN